MVTLFSIKGGQFTRTCLRNSANFYTARIQLCKTMVNVLNVAEKNSVAKGVAQILSNGQLRTRNGRSPYNKIYEFPFMFMGRQSFMVVTSVAGHLLHLEFAPGFSKWESCNPLQLFEAPVQKICSKDYMPIKETLEAESRKAHILVIWTDCDREGENIGYEIIDVCSKVKANLDVYRAKFSDVTAQSINTAVRQLQRPNRRLNEAVDVRIELDLRIGAAFTRFQTLRFQKIFPGTLSDSLISYGSCQFPTLGFVVERYKQIKAFISESFWKLKVTYKTQEGEDLFNWERGRLFDRNACLIFHQICLKNPTATVVDIKSKHKSKWRPLPLDTVEFQKLASRKLKINAQLAMTIAERLYTSGFISYPRTETNSFSKQFDLRPLVDMQTSSPEWGAFASRILDDGPNPRNGNKSDDAHPPIHPTKYTNNLAGDEKRLYEFIVRHFLACLSKDAEGFETTVVIDIAAERFSASGLMITAKNYLEVYPYDKWSDKNILLYTIGQTFHPTEIQMVDGTTSPPPLLTEADLIALMEKHGIGTDATQAEHIETVKKRQYVGVQDGKFVPGKLGMGLVEGYDAMGFEMSKPKLRAALESDLKKICDGLADPRIVLQNQIEIYKNVFIQSVEQVRKIDETLGRYLGETVLEQNLPTQVVGDILETVMKCPKCGSNMNLKIKREGNGFYISCSAFPLCKHVIWLPKDVKNVSVSDRFCEDCHPTPVKKLNFTFAKNAFYPTFPDNYTGCVAGCDPALMRVLGIRVPIIANTRTEINTTPNVFPTSIHNQMQTPVTTHYQRTVSSRNEQNATPFGNMRTEVSLNRPDAVVNCNCGNPAKLLTVRKEGPNTGRQFYACQKSMSEKCDFFHWADDNVTGNQTLPQNNKWKPNERRGGDSVKRRKCGECRQEGHTKKTCPSLKK